MWRPPLLPALAFLLILSFLASPTPKAHAECKRCGPKTCSEGETCCNRGCGICAAPGEGCIALFCFWGRPRAIDAEENPTTDVYSRRTAALSVGDYKLKLAGADVGSTTGSTLRVRLQRFLSASAAVRLGASGTALFRGKDEIGEDAAGWSLDAGATYRLPSLGRLLGSALTVDGEIIDGPALADTLTPVVMGAGFTATVAGGLVLEDIMNAVPFTAHARLVHSRVEDSENRSVIDLGLTFSAKLDRMVYWPRGKPFPMGARLTYGHAREVSDGDFREHEFGAGLYYLGKDKLRLGLDLELGYQRLSEDLKGRRLTGMLRADWYWDANY